MAGAVTVGDITVDKPGTLVDQEAVIKVTEDPCPYVSRGGLKIEGAIEAFGLNVSDLVAFDIGASTGGFTDCLLKSGARKVYALDVGYGQLAWSLRMDRRVCPIERTNIRHYDGGDLEDPIDLAVIDTSFISLRLVIPAVLKFVRPGGLILALIKPQFEAGKREVGKGGVVRNPEVQRQVVEGLISFSRTLGLKVQGTCESPLTGPKGNREYFILLEK